MRHELCLGGTYPRCLVDVPASVKTVTRPGRLAHCILRFLSDRCPMEPQPNPEAGGSDGRGGRSFTITVRWASERTGATEGGAGEEEWEDGEIGDVSSEEVSGRLVGYEWEAARWREDAALALRALLVLAACDAPVAPVCLCVCVYVCARACLVSLQSLDTSACVPSPLIHPMRPTAATTTSTSKQPRPPPFTSSATSRYSGSSWSRIRRPRARAKAPAAPSA